MEMECEMMKKTWLVGIWREKEDLMEDFRNDDTRGKQHRITEWVWLGNDYTKYALLWDNVIGSSEQAIPQRTKKLWGR